MLKRLLSLLSLLVFVGLLTASVSQAATISLVPTASSGPLEFSAQGISLSGVTSVTLTVGARRIALQAGVLRRADRARDILVERVSIPAAARAGVKLVLGGGGTSQAHSAHSVMPLVKIESIVLARRTRGATAPPSSGSSTSAPPATTAPPSTGTTTAPPSTGTTTTTPPTTTTPTPPATTPSSSGSAGPVVGINVGSAIQWELQFAQTLGAKNVRMNFNINTPTSQMDPIIAAYAAAGIRPELLATFDAGTIPTAAEIANLDSWVARYGPGGTFWSQTGYPATLAVTRIEFGNESSGAWQYPQLSNVSSWWSSSYYAQVAQSYGQAYVQAVQDVNAVNPAVKLLAVADSPGQVPQWLQNMFAGAPTLKNVVEGWVLHPYGNDWQNDVDATLAQTEALGASANVPVYVTEVGVATDDGNCLDDNYGWNTCLSYAAAASTITSQVQGIESDLGSRLAELDLYSARDIDATGTSTDREGFFGALQSGGQPKGLYTSAVESILATTAS